MPNMGYCRFQNTLSDLRDCLEHWDDELSEAESKARARLLRLCSQIGTDYEFDDSDDAA